MVLLSAVGFSAKAVVVKLAYRYNVDPITVLSLRMGFSLPFFVAMAIIGELRSKERIAGRDALNLVALGLIGYYLSTLLDFKGLEYASAGLERLILFLYPTMTVILSAIFLGRKITKRDGVALGLSYGGIVLAVSHDLAVSGPNVMLGAVLIFACAFTWSSYLVGAEGVIARVGAVRFTGYAMVVSTTAAFIHYFAANGGAILIQPREVYKLSMIMAIFSTVIPILMFSIGMRRIGASNTAIISSVGPVFTIFLAYVYLGEKISALQIAGTALIITGVMSIKKR